MVKEQEVFKDENGEVRYHKGKPIKYPRTKNCELGVYINDKEDLIKVIVPYYRSDLDMWSHYFLTLFVKENVIYYRSLIRDPYGNQRGYEDCIIPVRRDTKWNLLNILSTLHHGVTSDEDPLIAEYVRQKIQEFSWYRFRPPTGDFLKQLIRVLY